MFDKWDERLGGVVNNGKYMRQRFGLEIDPLFSKKPSKLVVSKGAFRIGVSPISIADRAQSLELMTCINHLDRKFSSGELEEYDELLADFILFLNDSAILLIDLNEEKGRKLKAILDALASKPAREARDRLDLTFERITIEVGSPRFTEVLEFAVSRRFDSYHLTRMYPLDAS